MPIHLAIDTSTALGSDLKNCDSRSLFQTHLADPTLKDHGRKQWFQNLIARQSVSRTPWHPPTAVLLRAQLKSRLMVNMAGGVMENAGLSLDRYGLPHLPGSAVKGCARRAALAALREWCETGIKPAGEDNLFTTLCQPFSTPSALLTTIASTFGWVETDWSTDKNKNDTWQSDFAWACAAASATAQPTSDTPAPTGHTIPAQGNALGPPTPPRSSPVGAAQRLRTIMDAALAQLGHHKQFAGTIAFLDARPNRDPGLILDVLTPHHKDYYEGKLKTATDTEDPVPVYFPAVKEQSKDDHFTFPLIPLQRATEALLTFATLALRTGLETFGLGAKTNAGYGWFDASEEFNIQTLDKLKADAERQEEMKKKASETKRLDEEAKAKAEAKAALASALAALSPDEQEDKKIEMMTAHQFEAKVSAFCKDPKKGGPSAAEQQAIVRALRGSRLDFWHDFKTKATKGEPATVVEAIRAISKKLNLGKMP